MSEDGTAIVEPTSRSAMDDREALERDVSDKDGIDAGDQRVEDVSETVDKHNQPEASVDDVSTAHEPLDMTDEDTEASSKNEHVENVPVENEPIQNVPVEKNEPVDQEIRKDPGDEEIENIEPGESSLNEPGSLPSDGPVDDGSSVQVPAVDDLTLEDPPADSLNSVGQDDITMEDADILLEGADVTECVMEETQRPLSSTVPLEDIVEEEEEDYVDRDQLIQDVKEALGDHNRQSALSAQLQHKIAEYLISRKKTEERADPGRTVTDHEKRYSQCMAALENLELEVKDMQDMFHQQDSELKVHRDYTLAQVQQANAEFAAYKREKSLTAVSSRSGKKLSAQELDHYQSCEDKKEEGVIQVRLENIKLQNKIAKLEALIKQKEQLAEGLHMIDFEQLKINNVDLNEKIEERNEDILKLRKKVTSTVQVLTHVKEKLQFLQTENAEKRNKLKEMDSVVAKRRDHLTRIKQARDSLRMDNIRLRQRGGLVAHSALLRDYEERKDQNEGLMSRLDFLHQRHSELSVMCDGLRRKIEQARTVNTHHM